MLIASEAMAVKNAETLPTTSRTYHASGALPICLIHSAYFSGNARAHVLRGRSLAHNGFRIEFWLPQLGHCPLNHVLSSGKRGAHPAVEEGACGPTLKSTMTKAWHRWQRMEWVRLMAVELYHVAGRRAIVLTDYADCGILQAAEYCRFVSE